MADLKTPFVVAMVFLFALDLWAGVLVSTGVANTLGLGIHDSGTNDADNIEKEFEKKQTTGSSTLDTLFGMYNTVAGSLGKISSMINPGLGILNSAGVPSYVINPFLKPIVTVIKGVGMVMFIRGL